MRLFSTLILMMAISGCDHSNTEIEQTDELLFMSSETPMRFGKSAFPEGQKFEVVRLKGGKKALWITSSSGATAIGGAGAPVVPLSTYNKFGLVLDENNCSTGEQLVSSWGAVTIHPQGGISTFGEVPEGVCFSYS